MLGWSINLFRVRGIQLALHGSFFLLLAYAGWEGWHDARWAGLIWGSLTLVVFFGCVVLHELGHSFVTLHYGIGVRRILLMPIGGMAEFDQIPREPRRELLITIAGPAVNFVIAGALWLVVRTFPDTVFPYSPRGLVAQVFMGNLVMGCFNLLPAFPMDGGRILRALLALRLPYLRATFWAVHAGRAVAVCGLVIALLLPELHWYPQRLWLLAALFAFIIVVGEMEYRMTKRREIEDAHWREVMLRLHGAPPPVEPPPVLTR
ncbi:MAG: hypothetical protein JSS11_17840 [Verrucomicrobia bacterium]|nr:hypothetical protein [Verrucomicrobiota bacterium]